MRTIPETQAALWCRVAPHTIHWYASVGVLRPLSGEPGYFVFEASDVALASVKLQEMRAGICPSSAVPS